MFSSTVQLLSLLSVLALAPRDTDHNKHLIGRKVMVVEWDAEVHRGTKVVRTLEYADVLVVAKVSGNWLWFNEAVGGWVKRSDVVKYEQAIAYSRRLIRQNPSGANFYHRALVWKARGNFDAALEDVNIAIVKGNLETGYNLRGELWRLKADYDRAIRDFSKVLQINPKCASAYNNRGLAWSDKGDCIQAIIDFNNALQHDPNNIATYNNRAFAWRQLGQRERAIRDYNELLHQDPKNVSAYYNRALVYQAQRDSDRAISDYEKVIQLDPHHYKAHGNLAWLLATCHKLEHQNGKRAIELACRTCELLNWQEDNALAILSAAYAAVGDFKQAEEFLNKAIDIDPDSAKETRARMMTAFKADRAYLE